ncbi:MAG: IS1634 family transposase [Legionellaceae bacterium]|nr:IS1634 family transposase [Legionellaceae bacterium]
MSFSNENVKSEQLGHLGLIAAVIQDLGIIDKIDARIELNESKGGIVSYGRRVAAMVLNGLGFMNSRLCMMAHFFQDKPVARMLGDEVTADNLNDDCLGRCLDKIAEYGTTKLYAELAFEIAREKSLLGKRLHLDSTSFTLEGRYDVDVPDGAPMPAYGYSKAHRPDLKQVMMSLVQGGEANIPLWIESLDGNSSDKKSFQETVRRVNSFMKGLQKNSAPLFFVVDSAFYVPEKLAELDDVFWITRVPAQLKEAKEWLKQAPSTLVWQRLNEHNRACDKIATIHGIKQRWLMVESKQAIEREEKTFQRKLNRLSEELIKKLWHLGNQIFQCQEDAEKAVAAVEKITKISPDSL